MKMKTKQLLNFEEGIIEEKNEKEEKKLTKTSQELINGIIDIIQFEIDKLTVISSAKHYFNVTGRIKRSEFLTSIYCKCEKTKLCFMNWLLDRIETLPEFKVRETIKFDDDKKPFEVLANMEDKYEEKINALINIAFEDKDWSSFNYLLKKLDKIDHLFCKVLTAIESGSDVCELLITEK